MLRLFLTASLLYNSYYPVSISKTRTNRGSLIRYANCEWYNNKCPISINEHYPNLEKYNHITVNEIDMNVNLLHRRLLENNVSIPLENYLIKNKHHVVAYNTDNERYEIISTPLTHSRTRVFIFSNKKYKFFL